MPLVTVPAHDSRIAFFGSRWKDDLFEIRPGIDPPSGGGVNATSGEVCKLGVKSRETWGFGNGFSFNFTGVAVRLIMESREDHGIYVVSLDGTQRATVSGYSLAPHCGAPFVADGLPLGKHTVSATLTAKDPASTWDYSYMQMFAVQYDPGSASNSTAQGPQSVNSHPSPIVVSQKAFSGAAIAGVTVGGFVLAFALSILAVWLVRRSRRRRGSFVAVPKNDAEYDGSEKPIPMRRGKGKRHSVLSDSGAPSPYTLHYTTQSASSPPPPLVRGSSPSPAASAISPNTPPPGLESPPHAAGHITAYPIPLAPPPPSLRVGPPLPKGQGLRDAAGAAPSPPSHTGSVRPPPAGEEGGTMLPPYRANY